VTVTGLAGNSAGNQTAAAITGLFPRTTWWLNLPTEAWPGTPTPGTLISVVSDGTVCTVNLSVAHGIQTGWRVIIYLSSLTGGAAYSVTSTPTPDSFTVNCSGSDGTAIAAGTYHADWPAGPFCTGETANSLCSHMAVIAEPGFSLTGTGNGNWSRSTDTRATVVATDDTKNFAEIEYTPPPSGPLPLSCDLNHDGVVNVLDVQMMVDEVVGTLPCTSMLDGTSACDNADVQIVITAALGGTCAIP
jgi:hypothetical protein